MPQMAIRLETNTDSLRRRYRPDETRERILSAAQSLFAQKGYADTSTADIAQEADVAEGSIFYHFGSKKNLMTEIGRAFGQAMVDHMRGDCANLADLTLEAMLRRCFVFCEEKGEPEKKVGLSGADPELQSMMSASREVVMAFVTDHMNAKLANFPSHGVDIPVGAALCYAAVHEAVHLCFQPDPPFEKERVIAETIRFVKTSFDPSVRCV